jgi:hypothetical protein
VARGQCGGGTRCFGMADFIDIAVDPAGRPWASLVDVCNARCAPDPKLHHDEPIGYLGTLLTGPSLRGGTLAPLAVQGPPVGEG